MKSVLLIGLFLLSVLWAQDWKQYPYIPAGGEIAFPVDEGNHPDYGGSLGQGMEWWYLNFHLQGVSSNRHYSAMITYFDFLLYPRIINIADEDQHLFYSQTSLGFLQSSSDSLNIHYFTYTGDTDYFRNLRDSSGMLPFQYELQAGDGDYQLNVTLDLVKRPLLIGQDGLIFFTTGSSYYYSLTYMNVQGNLVFAGVTDSVTGVAWMDHQYGPFMVGPGGAESYEWFSVQLSNGVDICFWNTFTAQNTIPQDDHHRLSTLYLNDTMQDTTSRFQLHRLQYWLYEPNAYFASQFNYVDTLHQINITITPVFQEQVVPFVNMQYFWEGSCQVSGTYQGNPVSGVAFAELLHIYREPMVDLLSPNGGEIIQDTFRVNWQLQNPDEGNPLQYDLFYSPDSGAHFYPLAQALTDTSYLWDVSGFPSGTGYLLSVVGYSVDSTIVGADTSDGYFSVQSSSAVSRENTVPATFTLMNAYPNPFNGRLTVTFRNISRTRVSFQVYDVLGHLIYTAPVKTFLPGTHRLYWNANSDSGWPVSSGIYVIRLKNEHRVFTRKVVLVR